MYFSSTILSDLLSYTVSQTVHFNQLEREFSVLMQQKQISYEEITKAINQIKELTQDEHIGLHLGELISLKATAYVDGIMQHSQTLEESFENAVEYSKVISDALECWMEKDKDFYSVYFEENPNWAVQQSFTKRQILDLTLLCTLKSLTTYTNHQFFPVKIDFKSDKPKKLSEYYRLFNCSLKFNQKSTRIVFEKQIFKKYSKANVAGLLEGFKEIVSKEIESLSPENRLIYELKKCILNHKPERVSIEKASDHLHVSTRTLQRKVNAPPSKDGGLVKD